MVRWVSKVSAGEDLDVEVIRRRQRSTVIIEAREANGRYRNLLAPQVIVISPDGSTAEYDARQVAPGRYESSFVSSSAGIYYITVFADDDGQALGPSTTGHAVAYPDEYRFVQTDETLLSRLAEMTGGSMLEPLKESIASAAYAPAKEESRNTRDLWPVFTGLALLLLVAEIAVRRFVMPERLKGAVSKLLVLRPARDRPAPDLAAADRMIAEGRSTSTRPYPISYWYRKKQEAASEESKIYFQHQKL